MKETVVERRCCVETHSFGNESGVTLLAFGDGTFLEAASAVLRGSSSVMQTALDECRPDGPLSVGADDKRVWTHLLRLLQAGHPVLLPRDAITQHRLHDAVHPRTGGRFSTGAAQGAVAQLAKKYGFVGVLQSLEEEMCRAIRLKRHFITASHDHRRLNPTLGTDGTRLFSLIALGAQLDFEKVFQESVSYFVHYFNRASHVNWGNGRSEPTQVGHQLWDLFDVMEKEGLSEFGKRMSYELIRRMKMT